ncbi:MAG: Cytochrome c oxidase polypeptide [Myxococcaceae bacterium]|nr:Cytochrome c oxidase polypeptide [Myxococcaceae bacterium]
MMELFRAMLGLPPGASTAADGVDLLHFFVIGVTMLISTYVFAAAAWFCIRYYRKSDAQLTEHLGATRRAEALTIVAVLGMFILWWVIGFRQYVHMAEPPKDATVVYVDAKQWMWTFTYPGGRSTNDVLTVPIGRPIKLVMTSRDVIHSFYVPAFRTKTDVIPGRYTTVWFEATQEGSYPIWCAEYCGVSHSLMRGEVKVLSQDDYAKWEHEGRDGAMRTDCGRGPGSCGGGDLVELGRAVAVRRACVACHTFDGQRHVGPTWSGLYGSERTLANGRRVVADEAYLTKSMMEPNADVVAGYPQVMPTYQGVLTAPEAGALVELIRSLKDGPVASGVELPRLDVAPAADGGPPP